MDFEKSPLKKGTLAVHISILSYCLNLYPISVVVNRYKSKSK